MSQRTAQLIIGRILTDEELRQKFLVSPRETLAWLREMGFELTDTEVEALSHTDDWLWTSGAEAIDGRLRQCCLKRTRGVT
jgi:hypothetical protein